MELQDILKGLKAKAAEAKKMTGCSRQNSIKKPDRYSIPVGFSDTIG